MKQRLYKTLVILLIITLSSSFVFNLLEPTSHAFHFKRKILKARFITETPNSGFGRIISVNDRGFVFIDNKYKRIVTKFKTSPILYYADSAGTNLPYYFVTNAIESNTGIYSFCGNYKEIRLDGKFEKKTYEIPFSFGRGILTDDSTAIFRTTSSQHEFLIGVYGLKSKKVRWSTLNNNLEPKGGLATDGELLYDNKKYLYFVNTYNSSIVKFDKNLKTSAIFHTIDNTKKLPEIVFLKKSHSYHFASMHTIINESSTVFGNILYVVSTAQGENKEQNFVNYIDVYNTNSGKYLYSYGIPHDVGSVLNIIIDTKGKLYLLTEKMLKCLS